MKFAMTESSWLVQRLEKPWPKSTGPLAALGDNPFSFGGGLKNGGLSDDAMSLIRDIFSFDYMGAAEFEFGAVPKALERMAAQADELVGFSFEIPLKDVPKNWRDKSKKEPEGNATIYALCPIEWVPEVEKRIYEWATTEYPHLKESTRLPSALRPVEEWDERVCGWLELDNGFMFFTDEDMWRKTCNLFGATNCTED